jgi:hypothetical protein
VSDEPEQDDRTEDDRVDADGTGVDDDTVDRPSPGGPPRWVLIVTGLVVGLLIGGGLAWWSSRDDGDSDTEDVDSGELTGPADLDESSEAADAFVEAWERSRTETYLSGSLLRRTLSNSTVLELPIVVAQRPPDRVVSTGGAVQGSVDGENQVCDEQLDGLVRCRSIGDAEDYDASVESDVATLQGYFTGPTPVYRVSQEGQCFNLRLTAAIQAPPYGQNARFCFDEVSGAPSLQLIERLEGTDEVTLVSVRTDVSDADIAAVSAGEIDEALLEG